MEYIEVSRKSKELLSNKITEIRLRSKNEVNKQIIIIKKRMLQMQASKSFQCKEIQEDCY